MTGIVPSTPAIGLAGSFGNAQRTDGPASKADAATDAANFAQRAVGLTREGGVAGSDMNAERDADGRTPWSSPEGNDAAGDAETPGDEAAPEAAKRPPVDPQGLRGTRLDIEA